MMDESKHIIKSQRFQVTMSGEKDAHQIQSDISNVQDSRTRQLIEQVMDKFDPQDSIYQFDEVELELGTLSKNNFENELIQRIEEELTAFLRNNIKANGDLRNGKRILNANQSISQFIHFLEHGYLDRTRNFSSSPKQLLHQLIDGHTSQLISILKKYGSNYLIRQRLIAQFKDPELESIVKAIAPAESSYMLLYKSEMIKQQERKQTVEVAIGAYRNAVWEVVLAYLFKQEGSYYNRKAFLHFLIESIAIKYNMTYETLLKLSFQAISKEKGAPTAFNKILEELNEEINSKGIIGNVQSTPEKSKFFLELITEYIVRGTFSWNVKPLSKSELNHRLFALIQTNEQAFKPYFKKWFLKTDRVERLYYLLGDRLVDLLLEKIDEKAYSRIKDFEQVISVDMSKLDYHVGAKWKKIESIITLLYLRTLVIRGKSSEPLESIFLKEVEAEFSLDKASFVLILEQLSLTLPIAKSSIVKKHLSAITITEKSQASRLQNFWKKLEGQLKLALKRVDQTEWSTWFKIQLESYQKSFDKDSRNFFNQLRHMLEKLEVPTHVVDEWIKAGVRSREEYEFRLFSTLSGEKESASVKEASQVSSLIVLAFLKDVYALTLIDITKTERLAKVVEALIKQSDKYRIELNLLLKEAIKQSGKNEALSKLHAYLVDLSKSSELKEIRHVQAQKLDQKTKEQLVTYFLEKGSLPWWIASYSLDRFNADFESIWSSENIRKRLIDALNKSEHVNEFSKTLSLKNQFKVLAALPTKSATNKFLIGTNQQSGLWILLEIIERNLVPAGIVSVQEFLALKSRLFTYIIEHKQSSPNELMIEFEKWVVTNKKLQTTSGLALLYEAIKNVEFKSDTAQAKVYSELKSRLIKNREEHIVFHSLPKSLEGFLQIHEGISKIRYASSSSLTVRLMAIREKEEQQISLWLGLSEFRTTLFKDLSIKELQAFITDLIHPIQRQYFISGFSLYQESKLLSVGQRKILEFKYLELILISLSTRSLDTWSHQNWAFLLTEIGKLELGEKRTIELILNLQESVVGSPKQNNEVYITLITSVLEELSQISHAQAPKVKNYQGLKNDEQEIEEKDYKKLGEKEPHELIDPLFIDNAGLILLWPFLAMLFDRCGLTINGDFLEDQNRHKAALLLHYAATGSVDLDTPETTIHKVLCGIHPTFPLDQGVDVNVENLKVVDGLLYNITQQWSPLKGTSIDSLRSSFIQREGRLEEEEDRFYMIIEKKAFDMLLNQIPWNIDKIKLSWMHKMLEVEWNT